MSVKQLHILQSGCGLTLFRGSFAGKQRGSGKFVTLDNDDLLQEFMEPGTVRLN
jgi:hypothetical protein